MEDALRAQVSRLVEEVDDAKLGREAATGALVVAKAREEELELALAWERLDWKNQAARLEARLQEREERVHQLTEEMVRQVGLHYSKLLIVLGSIRYHVSIILGIMCQ